MYRTFNGSKWTSPTTVAGGRVEAHTPAALETNSFSFPAPAVVNGLLYDVSTEIPPSGGFGDQMYSALDGTTWTPAVTIPSSLSCNGVAAAGYGNSLVVAWQNADCAGCERPPRSGGQLLGESTEVVSIAAHVLHRVLHRERPVLLRARGHQDPPVGLVVPGEVGHRRVDLQVIAVAAHRRAPVGDAAARGGAHHVVGEVALARSYSRSIQELEARRHDRQVRRFVAIEDLGQLGWIGGVAKR